MSVIETFGYLETSVLSYIISRLKGRNVLCKNLDIQFSALANLFGITFTGNAQSSKIREPINIYIYVCILYNDTIKR